MWYILYLSLNDQSMYHDIRGCVWSWNKTLMTKKNLLIILISDRKTAGGYYKGEKKELSK